ncbi:hypothetical protein KUTeg_015663 [Tegillarca granosa]|uniref:Fibrinogen C-terminal domain-containing protein n=1 Tax=Tegillarca granosa TaxID=220873 RepID=A0ABQ9ENF3_TEGGR|nr:hypothetical protein KUTeg_015663 [Tegillarca granosa]
MQQRRCSLKITMLVILTTFALLCVSITFCQQNNQPVQDMECVCINKQSKRMTVQMQITETSSCEETTHNDLRPVDCKEVYDNGNRSNGVYKIYPEGNIHGYYVYCDMTTDGGGWTVIQKRFNGGIDFYRTWAEYRNGFGDINGEYWLGNAKIHELTLQSNQVLRIDMMDDSGTWKYATYIEFSIGGNSTGYNLSVGTFNGNAGDSLRPHHNGYEFRTKDRVDERNCPIKYTGAWWYNSCHTSNLNGKYGDDRFGKGLNWKSWLGHQKSLSKTEMKIRREEN